MFKTLSQFWETIQGSLFPWIEEELGELTEKQKQLVSIFELIRVEDHIPQHFKLRGRPKKDRVPIARAFVAKAVYNMTTTRSLLDRLECDIALRRLCGWEKKSDIPDETTFSRAFTEFAKSELPSKVHSSVILKVFNNRIVGHVSRDSTEVIAREKPLLKEKKAKIVKQKKRGRPKKGEERPLKEPTRLEKQQSMTLDAMLADLPKPCDVGTKLDSKGYKHSWIGYKLHIDTADGDIPLGCILTSASLHDSQASIPLAEQTASKVVSLYDLMDSAYDSPLISEHSRSLGHIAIIDTNPRRNTDLKKELELKNKSQRVLNWKLPKDRRYDQRSSAERVNSRLKDDFGGRMVRVRGNLKVACHLGFGILALTADQILNLVR